MRKEIPCTDVKPAIVTFIIMLSHQVNQETGGETRAKEGGRRRGKETLNTNHYFLWGCTQTCLSLWPIYEI